MMMTRRRRHRNTSADCTQHMMKSFLMKSRTASFSLLLSPSLSHDVSHTSQRTTRRLIFGICGFIINSCLIPSSRSCFTSVNYRTFICTQKRLNSQQIAWLKVDTQTILSIQTHIITKNHRMTVTHAENRAWVLRIKDVRELDKGW